MPLKTSKKRPSPPKKPKLEGKISKTTDLFYAIELAAKAHRNQRRKSTKIPYITHPMGVMQILLEYGCSEEQATAGLLHDTLEDTRITQKDILNYFGDTVLKMVKDCTEPGAQGGVKGASWETRKKHTIDNISELDILSVEVVCADKLHNLRSMVEDFKKQGENLWKRFRRPRKEQEWYYRGLAEAFKKRKKESASPALFDEFIHLVGVFFKPEKPVRAKRLSKSVGL